MSPLPENPAASRPSLLWLGFEDFAEAGRRACLAGRGTAKGSGVAGSLYGRFFREGRWDPAATGLGAEAAALWEGAVDVAVPAEVEAELSGGEGDDPRARKAVLRLGDGQRVETVLVPMDGSSGGRGTLCVSSQAGCAMACAFCETARQGLVRDLSAAEIVAQVFLARFRLGWEFTGIVFMGMGEPLANLAGLLPALRVLADPRGFAFSQERLTVCTVGLVDGIAALAGLGWKKLGLSLSLNAGRQELRERLMPAARANRLEALAEALAAYPQRRNAAIALNYCLLPGINDGEADAAAVAEFAGRIGRCVVNLIPYNPGRRPLCAAPGAQEIDAFMSRLSAAGVMVKLRGPKGRSIMAGCGQLGSHAGA
jgi:23S rRNA (adenine2503-C2)-methyltransferase